MKTFQQALAERGLKDPKPRSVAYWNSRPIAGSRCRVPDATDVLHRALVEAQGPLFTFNPKVEYQDEVQFSSKSLTDWYVREFERLNGLRRTT